MLAQLQMTFSNLCKPVPRDWRDPGPHLKNDVETGAVLGPTGPFAVYQPEQELETNNFVHPVSAHQDVF